MRKKIYVFGSMFFLIDLISKIVIMSLNMKMPYTIIKNFFYIDLVSNDGAAFSILSGNTIFFIVLAVLALFYIDKYVTYDIKRFLSVSLAIGGIVGNLFDRLIYGYVIDFLSFKFGFYYFPIFNLADVFICVGAFMILIEYIGGQINGDKSK